MVKDNDESWTLPQRKVITKEVLDRAIAAEGKAGSLEHQAREAWFDVQHGTVMLKLVDGRVFGAEAWLHSIATRGIVRATRQSARVS